MKNKIILLLVLLLASCEPNITKEFKFERKDSFELNPVAPRTSIGLPTTNGAMNFEFSTNLTLSYSEDDNLTYFHWIEKIDNMSLDDKFFNTKPFCRGLRFYDENKTGCGGLLPERDGKYFRDEQNNLNCKGALPGYTLEKLKKIRWYGMYLDYALHFTNNPHGFFYQRIPVDYPPSTKQKN